MQRSIISGVLAVGVVAVKPLPALSALSPSSFVR